MNQVEIENQSYKSVILLEADRVINRVSGYTTAKGNSQHSLIFPYLIQKYDLEKALYYYEASESGSALIAHASIIGGMC